MMIIIWDTYGILLTEYILCETTISDRYYASIMERLRCAIVEICHSKISHGVLLLYENAPGSQVQYC